jgi:uncharacterized membrane protein YdfJ with MMPL/SSD domain
MRHALEPPRRAAHIIDPNHAAKIAVAVGILVDAVVVRTLLVPALVAIMGRWNWWMPGGLARLLRLTATATTEDPAAA